MQQAAIVILNFNGEETLRKFLPSVVNHSSYPVIVSDNASTDSSVDFLRSHYPQISIIQMEDNFGFAGGYTRALNTIRGEFEYYILLNSDVEVTPHWDENMIAWLEKRKDVAAVQPKILSYQNPDFFDYAGAAGGYMDNLGYPYCRGRFFETIEKDQGQYDDEVEVDWTSGACMAIRSEAFHRGQGFDPAYFAHMEEIDLCWKLRRMGYTLYYTGAVKVYHVGGATLSRTSPRKTYLNFRNNLAALKNNMSPFKWRSVYLMRCLLDLLAAIVFLIQGKGDHSMMIWKAHRDFRKIAKGFDKYFGPMVHTKGKIKFLLWRYYFLGSRKYLNS